MVRVDRTRPGGVTGKIGKRVLAGYFGHIAILEKAPKREDFSARALDKVHDFGENENRKPLRTHIFLSCRARLSTVNHAHMCMAQVDL